MRWSTGDRGNINDMRGRSGGGGHDPARVSAASSSSRLLSMFTGVDLFSILGGGGSPQPTAVGTSGRGKVNASPDRREARRHGRRGGARRAGDMGQCSAASYQPTKVTLFRDSIQSACGYAGAVSGPFYCPGDRKVYLDLSFFDELARRFGASGDFAQAYVLAHEFGHHVQSLSGTEAQRPRAAARRIRRSGNALSVRLELQADCYAGVWGHDAAKPGRAAQGKVELDPGDLEEALRAAVCYRRRSAAETRHGPRHAREIHARQLRAAHDVVQARIRHRRSAAVRYFRQQRNAIESSAFRRPRRNSIARSSKGPSLAPSGVSRGPP